MILKLQHKLKTSEFEKDKLTEQLDVIERFISRTKFRDRTKDSIRVRGRQPTRECRKEPRNTYLLEHTSRLQVQELEIENDKLRKDLESLRKLVLKKQGDEAADEILGN